MSEVLELGRESQELLFRQARTANSFTSDEVGDEVIAAIYDLVKWGPSSGNTQPLRYLVVRSTEAREKLITHMFDANKVKTASAPLTVVLAADHGFHAHMNRLLPYLPNAAARFADPDVRAKAAQFNATLQCGYFIIGVRAAGLAAGPMLGFDNDGVDREFFPDGRLKSILVVNVGHPGPDAWMERLPRLDGDEVLSVI